MLNVRAAEPSELRDVLGMTLGLSGLPPGALERQIDQFIAYAREMKLDLSHHWIALDGHHPLTGCTYLESPGHTAMLLLPPATRESSGDALVALLQASTNQARRRGIRLLQCLVDPASGQTQDLAKAGFKHLSRLNYLECEASTTSPRQSRAPASSDTSVDFPASPLSNTQPIDMNVKKNLRWLTYTDSAHALFARTILDSYIGTMDCPGLNGLRGIDDVIAGHKAAARFQPEQWSLLCNGDEPRGCVLVGEIPLRGCAELIYMGLRPAARGCGLGNILLTRALDVTRRAGLRALTLAVDAANEPARRLYHRFGFRATMSRDAWILVPDAAANG